MANKVRYMWAMKITVSPNIVALPAAHIFTTTDTDDDKMRSAKTVVTSVISETLCSIPGMCVYVVCSRDCAIQIMTWFSPLFCS